MAGDSINLFMWGYQPHFRADLEIRAKNVFETLGVYLEPKALLVGVRRPDSDNRNAVCVEPENDKWPLSLFDGLSESVEDMIKQHPLQNIIYGDEPSMQEKPERIRRDSIRQAVLRALEPFDTENCLRSFCGIACSVEHFYVVPVVQLPDGLFEAFPPLHGPIGDDRISGHPSLIHAAMSYLLSEATEELQRTDPGRHFGQKMRSAEEIVRLAAANFMKTPGVAIGDRNFYFDLFEQFNVISSLMYEGAEGTGRLLFAKPDGGAVEMLLALAEPVPFRKPRWSRKVLQMASSEVALVADCEKVFGLGNIADEVDPRVEQNVFEIEFLNHYHWRLSCGDNVMLESRYGVPSLPQEPFPKTRLVDTFNRLFPNTNEEDLDGFLTLFETAISQRHGSMLVVAEDVASEAKRLRGQGTRVEPTWLTPELYKRVSDIDGTIIIDPHCVCHAIGVILDGPARVECTPSRGSRYNSGIRYVDASKSARLAVVVSDDHTVDVIPVLQLRIRQSEVESRIAKLEGTTRNNYHSSINWLDRHRFYLRQPQCDRVNAALERIKNEPMDVGEIGIQWSEFTQNPDLDDSYFTEDPALS